MPTLIKIGGGYSIGYDDGRADGYNSGHSDGYNQGYNDGYHDPLLITSFATVEHGEKYGPVIDSGNTKTKTIAYSACYIGENWEAHGGYARIEGSNDGSNWAVIINQTSVAAQFGPTPTVNTTSSAYRYFRTHVYGAWGGDRVGALVAIAKLAD